MGIVACQHDALSLPLKILLFLSCGNFKVSCLIREACFHSPICEAIFNERVGDNPLGRYKVVCVATQDGFTLQFHCCKQQVLGDLGRWHTRP